MFSFFKKDWLLLVVLAGALAALGYVYANRYVPCETPITYGIGSYDPRFALSEEEFGQRLDQAAAVWNKAISKDIFVRGAEPKLPVYVVYDERQRTEDKAQSISDTIDAKKAQATALGNRYEERKAEGAKAAELNALAAEYNRLIDEVNAQVSAYNRTIPQEEYNEARYVADRSGTRIYVYEFTDAAELTRVLEHELGHALGLDHVSDEKSVMYPINTGKSTALTSSDLAELVRVCPALGEANQVSI